MTDVDSIIGQTPTPTPWHRQAMVGFDTETTGVDPMRAELLSAAMVGIVQDKMTTPREWLAKPTLPIPPEASKINGLTDEYCATYGEDMEVVVTDLVTTISGLADAGVPLVIYNARYDVTLIQCHAARLNLTWRLKWPPIIDPMIIWKQVQKFRKGKRRLQDFVSAYGVDATNDHTALGDVMATLRGTWKMAQQNPSIHYSPRFLHEHQIVWAAEQAEGLQAFMRSKGGPNRDVVLDRGWPLSDQFTLEAACMPITLPDSSSDKPQPDQWDPTTEHLREATVSDDWPPPSASPPTWFSS